MQCGAISQKLNQYLDNELSDIERTTVGEHLKVCTECVAELKSFQALDAMLSTIPPIPAIPPNFAKETVRKALSMTERQYSFSDWWRSVTFAWKAAACSVALAGIILGGMLAKQPFGQAAPIAGINKILFAENEPSLSKTYTMALLAGGER